MCRSPDAATLFEALFRALFEALFEALLPQLRPHTGHIARRHRRSRVAPRIADKRQHARHFTWTGTAQATLAVYLELDRTPGILRRGS